MLSEDEVLTQFRLSAILWIVLKFKEEGEIMAKQQKRRRKKRDIFAPGWLYRQMQKNARDVAKWPKWMRDGAIKLD